MLNRTWSDETTIVSLQKRSGREECRAKFLLGQRQQRLHSGERWGWIDELMAATSHQVAIDNIRIGRSDYCQLSDAIEIDSGECATSPAFKANWTI